MIQGLVAIFLASILTENYILSKFLGICPFLGVSKKVNTAVGMSVAVTFVMVLATAVTWPIYTYLLVPNDLAYLQTIVFILIIAALVQLVEIVLRKYIPSLYNALGIYLPLITTNCAVLGVTMLVLEKGDVYKRQDGILYHHLLDPSTGYPAENNLLSVSVVAQTGVLSDLLSTACFVLGLDNSLSVLEHYDAQAIFITRDKEVYITEGLKDRFTVSSQAYTLKELQ